MTVSASLSRDRVDRLGFFTEVNVETQDVPGSPTRWTVINVAEKPTGSLQLGAGFSSAEKVRCRSVSSRKTSLARATTWVSMSTPASTAVPWCSAPPTRTSHQDGISRTVDLYYRTDKPYEDQGGNYELVTTGASMRFGMPFSETTRSSSAAALSRPRSSQAPISRPRTWPMPTRMGYSSNSIPLTVGWSRDDRDSALAPNSGRYQRLNSEWSVAGDARYLRAQLPVPAVHPAEQALHRGVQRRTGLRQGLNGRPFPVFKNFYSGGLGSVRGFDQGTLGPRDVTGASLGGPKKVTLNAEVIAPFPGAGNDRTLRVFTFVDVGNVYGENQKVTFSDMRASAGLGLSWISPLGPLRLAFAKPVRKFAGDKIQKLQFQIGTSF
jgi:outer membrane protein insertion porin family